MPKAPTRKASDWQKVIANIEINKMPKAAAFREAFPDEAERSDESICATIRTFENSDLYISLRDATMVGIGNTLQKKAEAAAEKMLDTYSDLLDEGTETIRKAEDTDKRMLAMAAQRSNLAMDSNPLQVIENLSNENRNKELPEQSSTIADAVITE